MNELVFWAGLAVIVQTYMSLWFLMALYTKRYDVVDSAWGLGFVLVAWVSLALNGKPSTVQIVSALLVSLWGLRLFVHIARRNWRKHQDDHRYEELRAAWGKHEKRKAYTNVFLLQGVLVLLVSTPMVAIAQANQPTLNVGVVIGWIIWVFGMAFEAAADYQLANFLHHRKKGSHELTNKGLWGYSRHPNYFGEITTWWGAAVVAVSVGGWWGVIGALTITLLITKVSGIPPLERHYKNNPDFQAYAKKTSVLIPLPKRKG